MTDDRLERAPLRFFLAGAAHLDRRGRPLGVFQPAVSNPGTVTTSIGGAAFNAAATLRLFGAEVVLVSARGGDPEGERVEAALAEAGIADRGMIWLDRRTAGYTAILDEAGELVAAIADMQLYDMMSRRIFMRRHIRDEMAAADVLLLDANLPAATINHLVDGFAGRLIAAIGVSPAKVGRLVGRLDAVSLLFLSRAEAASLVGAPDETAVAVLAIRLSEFGVRRAVVTDGPSDAALLDGTHVLLQAPPVVEALTDVTGAGDTLAAAASLAFAEGAAFADAVRLGMAAASQRIGRGLADGGAAPIDIVAAEMAPPRLADGS